MPRPTLEQTGKPEISNMMLRKIENLRQHVLHPNCYKLPNSERCDDCQKTETLVEIIKVQFLSEMAILPQLRRVARRAQDALIYLQTWITMNSKVDGGMLVRRYNENPQEAGLNAAPTQEDPDANMDFTQEDLDTLNG